MPPSQERRRSTLSSSEKEQKETSVSGTTTTTITTLEESSLPSSLSNKRENLSNSEIWSSRTEGSNSKPPDDGPVGFLSGPIRGGTVFLSTNNSHQQQQQDKPNLSRNNTSTSPSTAMTSLVCGLTAGVLQAGLFNPYDRALYLSVTQKRPFLHRKNWMHPYAGVFQSLGIRALSGGLYFPIEHWLLEQMEFSPAIAGSATGVFTASLVNPLTALKYMTWSNTVSSTRAHSTSKARPTSAAQAFTSMSRPHRLLVRGLGPTIVRDVVFGGVYTAVRKRLAAHEYPVVMANGCAAALATVASGPWNYVRNVQYATLATTTTTSSKTKMNRSTYAILYRLVRHALEQPTIPERLSIVAARLRIGWGTARVAIGMTFGHAVYDGLHQLLEQS